ncbi:MAG: hypothetical protein ACOC2W_01070 [bacterium]
MSGKRLTKSGREKIVREMTEVFKEHGVYSNISFVYNNKMVQVGTSDIDLEASNDDELVYTQPKITVIEGRDPSDFNGNDDTIVVIYDGGPLYSCMTNEFGWKWQERLMIDLEKVLGPYWLGIEEINHYSFTLIKDVQPSYEKVANKLARG